jgi:hypothetical protein
VEQGDRSSRTLRRSSDLDRERATAERATSGLVGNVVPADDQRSTTSTGTFSRPIVSAQPTPGVAGLVVDALGNVYWANLGLAPCDTVLCPVDGLGTLWKGSFDPVTDAPLPPVLLQSQLTYPEGMGIADPLPEPSMVAGLAAASLLLAALARRRAT